ncbi:hypothetical protein LCGC14_3025060 [marine sediment metagenome]|uniref:Uncharacterized protein n=1 Tax=marine sediment metagenome TaxID=412755 RepID=A0A0F8WUL7_9ZZZZ
MPEGFILGPPGFILGPQPGFILGAPSEQLTLPEISPEITVDTPEALSLAAGAVQHDSALLHAAGVDAEVCEAAHVRIGGDLDGGRGERRIILHTVHPVAINARPTKNVFTKLPPRSFALPLIPTRRCPRCWAQTTPFGLSG